MSTRSTGPADQPAEPEGPTQPLPQADPGPQPEPAPQESTVEAPHLAAPEVIEPTAPIDAEANAPRKPRVPLPAFIVAYAALVAICIALVVNLYNYDNLPPKSVTVTTTTTVTDPPPPPRDEANVTASINPQFVANAQTAVNNTGVIVTGELTDQAMADLPGSLGHLNRLLEQNCVDSLSVTTPDNARISFTGFCFRGLDPRSIERMVALTLDTGADSVQFTNYPDRGFSTHAGVRWFTSSDREVDALRDDWNSFRRPADIVSVDFFAFTQEKLYRVTKSRGAPDRELINDIHTPGEGNQAD